MGVSHVARIGDVLYLDAYECAEKMWDTSHLCLCLLVLLCVCL